MSRKNAEGSTKKPGKSTRKPSPKPAAKSPAPSAGKPSREPAALKAKNAAKNTAKNAPSAKTPPSGAEVRSWVGGGAAHGPTVRDYTKNTPKAVKKLAFRKALSARILDGDVLIVESFAVAEPKTKLFVSLLDATAAAARKTLIVSAAFDEVTFKAARNVRKAQLTRAEAGNASTYTIRIGWTDRRGNGSDSAIGGSGGEFFGTGQRFVYTASRTVFEH